MKLRKIITMGLAAIMAVSAMSISAFAANIPMRSEVDTKAASADNPVTYRTEDGIKITIYDPNISLDFAEKEEPEIALANASGRVYIPNKELMDKFDEMLQKEASLGYVYRLAKESERMLKATLEIDTSTMEEILEYAHNTETPILSYNNEVELSSIVNLVYLCVRDSYRVEREDKAGLGFVDFIFYPENPADTGIILELKVDHTADEAVQQIIDKKYSLRFSGKAGEKAKYTGEILAVGIGYNKKTKKHQCRVITLRKDTLY